MNLSHEKIYEIALALDRALESRDTKAAVSLFADDCEIVVLGLTLNGKEGAKRWFNWLFGLLAEIKVILITTVIEGNTMLEEFIIDAKGHDGTRIKSKQAEVSLFDDNYKIKSLHVYFDRFDFADLVAKGFLARTILHEITRTSLRGLT